MTAVAILHRQEIIAGLASGKRLSQLGLGVSPQAISQELVADPEYQAAITAGFHARLDGREQEIETAASMLDVARAQAAFKATSWRAERECARVWSAKQEVTHHGGAPALQITIVQSHSGNAPAQLADDNTPQQ